MISKQLDLTFVMYWMGTLKDFPRNAGAQWTVVSYSYSHLLSPSVASLVPVRSISGSIFWEPCVLLCYDGDLGESLELSYGRAAHNAFPWGTVHSRSHIIIIIRKFRQLLYLSITVLKDLIMDWTAMINLNKALFNGTWKNRVLKEFYLIVNSS